MRSSKPRQRKSSAAMVFAYSKPTEHLRPIPGKGSPCLVSNTSHHITKAIGSVLLCNPSEQSMPMALKVSESTFITGNDLSPKNHEVKSLSINNPGILHPACIRTAGVVEYHSNF